jgi:hypothetical protein
MAILPYDGAYSFIVLPSPLVGLHLLLVATKEVTGRMGGGVIVTTGDMIAPVCMAKLVVAFIPLLCVEGVNVLFASGFVLVPIEVWSLFTLPHLHAVVSRLFQLVLRSKSLNTLFDHPIVPSEGIRPFLFPFRMVMLLSIIVPI